MRRLLLLAAAALPLACGGLDTSTLGSTASCTGTDTWASWGQSFMTSHCTACHGNFSSHATVQASSSSILGQISSGRMPQGSALTTADQTRVEAWLACGAP